MVNFKIWYELILRSKNKKEIIINNIKHYEKYINNIIILQTILNERKKSLMNLF